jgi:hypothetical protein
MSLRTENPETNLAVINELDDSDDDWWLVHGFVKSLWQVISLSLCLLLSTCILIILQANSKVILPRRETKVKSWALFTSILRACGLQGRRCCKLSVHPTKPPDDWRFKVPYQKEERSLRGYPVAHFGAFYSGILQYICVK